MQTILAFLNLIIGGKINLQTSVHDKNALNVHFKCTKMQIRVVVLWMGLRGESENTE